MGRLRPEGLQGAGPHFRGKVLRAVISLDSSPGQLLGLFLLCQTGTSASVGHLVSECAEERTWKGSLASVRGRQWAPRPPPPSVSGER